MGLVSLRMPGGWITMGLKTFIEKHLQERGMQDVKVAADCLRTPIGNTDRGCG